MLQGKNQLKCGSLDPFFYCVLTTAIMRSFHCYLAGCYIYLYCLMSCTPKSGRSYVSYLSRNIAI